MFWFRLCPSNARSSGHAHIEPKELIALEASLARPFTPSADCSSGTVATALVTSESKVFTGVSIDTSCSLGFCAEHAAVAEMLKARQSHVHMIVAVNKDGIVLPPFTAEEKAEKQKLAGAE